MRSLVYIRVVLALGLFGCQPEFPITASSITESTIIAIKADPAEALPGQSVAYTALVASPSGTASAAPITWTYCLAPKPPAEDNAVSVECLGSSAMVSIGAGATAAADLPPNACALFGPDVPTQPAGQPPLRPRDPDATGGFYQPVRAEFGTQTAIDLERITCDLAGASADVAAAYRMVRAPNQNPQLEALTVSLAARPIQLSQIPAGTRLGLSASWSATSSETYPAFDAQTDSLIQRREALRLSWFATAGDFDTDHTGTTADDPATSSDNSWTAPGTGGVVHLWIVLRDERGGLDYASYDLTVLPAP